MISPAALQSAILSLLCYDENLAPKLILQLDSKVFIGRSAKKIADTAIEYIKEFKRPPKNQIEILLEGELRRGEEGKLLGQTLDLLREQYTQLQPEFIIKELDEWQDTQKLTTVATEAIEALSRGELEQAKSILFSSEIRTPNKFKSNELWLSDAQAMLKFTNSVETEFFSSGVTAIDEVGATPERKTIGFIIAATGKGKSWFLVNAAKAALQFGRSALVITLEMSAEKWAKRLIQNMFSATSSVVESIRIPYFVRDQNSNISIQFEQLRRDSVLNRRKEIRQKLADITSFPPLVIKEFPTSALTISDLNFYLDYLEKEKNFKPDILLLDYAELMRLDTSNLRIDIGSLWKSLRGVASERDMAILSASQGNKDSDTAKVVDRGHVAEDWSKVGSADIVLTYSQTPEEKKLNLSRILIAKSRDSQDRIMILNSQSYQFGQFSLDSVVMSRDYAQELEKITTAEA